MLKKIHFFNILLMLSSALFLCCSCEPALPDPLLGLENQPVGRCVDLSAGRLYLPRAWRASDPAVWPVTVILHGYGVLSRSLSGMFDWPALGWETETMTQPDGHVLVEAQVRTALSRNQKTPGAPD